jgi:hypothetical protein
MELIRKKSFMFRRGAYGSYFRSDASFCTAMTATSINRFHINWFLFPLAVQISYFHEM